MREILSPSLLCRLLGLDLRGCHSYQSRSSGEEFLHHGLLEGAGFFTPML
jgi:hypothetical protein